MSWRGPLTAILSALMALVTAPAWANDAPPDISLVNPHQIDRERLAQRIMRQPEMRQAVRRVEAAYAADPAAAIPGARATLKRSASAIALAAVYYAIGLAADPGSPQLFWCCKAAQKAGRLAVGGSGYGIDNPDNIYRMTHVDGASRYIIRGQFRPDRAVQLHLEVRDAIPGTTAMTAEGGVQLATLRDDEIVADANGDFTITIDSDPAKGRVNHLQVPAEGTHHIVIRDLLTDWSKQRPIPMTIDRLGGPTLPTKSEAEIAHSAAALLDQIAPFWLDYDNRFIFSRPVNTLVQPRVRPGGRGMAASGHFAVRDDEMLAITIDPLGGASLGVQLTDPWGVAYDYIRRTSSLNSHQARHNSDGTITLVIARRDPGFVNWLDPSGHAGGILTLRWQGLPSGADPARAIRSVEVIDLAALRKRHPDPALWLTPAERRAQRADRAQTHAHRTTAPND
ncbi:MAG: DUF1214 domain-containing protein [Sphingomonadaceae bacterium]|nr:DUF1214 domain-containing protein [Sphingomonadaceae bacterium]